MKENHFYQQLSREVQQAQIPPSSESWEILESRLDDYSYKKKIRINLIRGIAASLLIGILAVTAFYEPKETKLVLEGPIALQAGMDETRQINAIPEIFKYQRLKDYERRINSNIKVVKNASTHYKYADLVELVTKPHAFHPEDFSTELDYIHFQKNYGDYRPTLMSGNWYLSYAESAFHKNIKIDVLSALKWTLTSEAIEDPQEYMCIPGQEKYYIKQDHESELMIIEIIDQTTFIMKKYNAENETFEEALYQKRDIG